MRLSYWDTPDIEGIAMSAVRAYGAIQKASELAEFIDTVWDEPLVVVEIGSYAGGTLWAWSQMSCRVYAVDLPPTGTYAATGTEQQTHGTQMVFGDSHDPATLEQLKTLIGGDPVDVLFIDGDHSYAGVKADHEMYAPLVRSGGFVAFHDIVAHPAQPDIEVHRYWEQIRTSDAIEIIHPTDPPWGGIGVLHASGN